MREFVGERAELAALRPGTRLAASLFLLFSLASCGVMVALAAQRSGFGAESAASYYAGDAERYPKTTGELLELTHFHLFSMPILLFVQGHLLLLTRWPRRLTRALVTLMFLGAALDLAAPWLIVHVDRELAWTKPLARALLVPGLLCSALVPLWDMWLGPRARSNGAPPDEPS